MAALLSCCVLPPMISPLSQGSPESGPQHVYVEVSGKRIHYVTMGAGLPVILLHSGGTSWHDWEAFIPELAESYRVIAPDFPGSGDSEELDGVHDLAAYTAFLESFLQTIGLSKGGIRLLGLSFGGMTALNYTLEHPDLVDRLVLLEVAHRYGHPERRGVLSALALLSKNKVARETIRWWIFQLGSRGMLLWLDLNTGRDFVRASSRATVEILLSWSKLQISTARLAELQVPVLVVAGEYDKEIPLEVVKEFQSALPNSRLLVVPDVSHYDLGTKTLGKRGAVDHAILDFLEAGSPQR